MSSARNVLWAGVRIRRACHLAQFVGLSTEYRKFRNLYSLTRWSTNWKSTVRTGRAHGKDHSKTLHLTFRSACTNQTNFLPGFKATKLHERKNCNVKKMPTHSLMMMSEIWSLDQCLNRSQWGCSNLAKTKMINIWMTNSERYWQRSKTRKTLRRAKKKQKAQTMICLVSWCDLRKTLMSHWIAPTTAKKISWKLKTKKKSQQLMTIQIKSNSTFLRNYQTSLKWRNRQLKSLTRISEKGKTRRSFNSRIRSRSRSYVMVSRAMQVKSI